MFFVPTHNSLFDTSDTELFEISARLKLVSVPFTNLFLDILQYVIIIERKCHVIYSSIISACISKSLPADFNTSIHVTGAFFFLRERGDGGNSYWRKLTWHQMLFIYLFIIILKRKNLINIYFLHT